jgi:hypothetical protein
MFPSRVFANIRPLLFRIAESLSQRRAVGVFLFLDPLAGLRISRKSKDSLEFRRRVGKKLLHDALGFANLGEAALR